MPRKLLERNYRRPSVMPGLFRHPPFRMIERREFAEGWTPEQVRGDEGLRKPIVYQNLEERADPSWEANPTAPPSAARNAPRLPA